MVLPLCVGRRAWQAIAFCTVAVAGNTLTTPSLAAPPTGYLDAAGCDVIAGWSQDPDEPAVGIAVHLYLGGPAGSGAPAQGITANLYREDLCAAIGSCEHGFSMPVPLSLLDGQAHNVHAYGIDSMGGVNPELGNSPKPLVCAPSASGVRRPVVQVGAVDAWKFSTFWDVLPLPSDQAAALAAGVEFPNVPELVTPDDGSGVIWLLDGKVRRAVTPGAAAMWRFDTGAAKVTSAVEIQAMVEGPPVRARPVLVVYNGLSVVDDVLPVVPEESTTAGTGGMGGSGGSGGVGGEAGNTGGADGGGKASDPKPAGCAVAGGEPMGRSKSDWGAFCWAVCVMGWMVRARRGAKLRSGSG
ncbi:MAG: hypothetical protein IPK82_18890 [Polyangiaceae bacterium]|nr:hypothetical protein [Polyangiaceae bacterium]